MPTRPCSTLMALALNTSRTRPLSLCTRRRVPSAVAMPAASWPRCWSTVRPSYSWPATLSLPTIPTMPHMMQISDGLLTGVGTGRRDRFAAGRRRFGIHRDGQCPAEGFDEHAGALEGAIIAVGLAVAKVEFAGRPFRQPARQPLRARHQERQRARLRPGRFAGQRAEG